MLVKKILVSVSTGIVLLAVLYSPVAAGHRGAVAVQFYTICKHLNVPGACAAAKPRGGKGYGYFWSKPARVPMWVMTFEDYVLPALDMAVVLLMVLGLYHRLTIPVYGRPRCRHCGVLLRELTEARCPHCGKPL